MMGDLKISHFPSTDGVSFLSYIYTHCATKPFAKILRDTQSETTKPWAHNTVGNNTLRPYIYELARSLWRGDLTFTLSKSNRYIFFTVVFAIGSKIIWRIAIHKRTAPGISRGEQLFALEPLWVSEDKKTLKVRFSGSVQAGLTTYDSRPSPPFPMIQTMVSLLNLHHYLQSFKRGSRRSHICLRLLKAMYAA